MEQTADLKQTDTNMEQIDTKMIGWKKLDDCYKDEYGWLSESEKKEVKSIAFGDFCNRTQIHNAKLIKMEEAEYQIDVCGGSLYNINLRVELGDNLNRYEKLIQMMVWKGVIWEITQISLLPTKPANENKLKIPKLRMFALLQLHEKLEGMGLSINHPFESTKLTPIVDWNATCIRDRPIGAGFDNTFEHSIVVNVKPPRGEESSPGVHGYWKLSIRERLWTRTLSFEEAASLKSAILTLAEDPSYPPPREPVTRDKESGLYCKVIRSVKPVHPLKLGCSLMVTTAMFALDTHNMEKGTELKLKRVVAAIHKRVAGSIYILTIETLHHGRIETYETTVRTKPWINFLESTPLVKIRLDPSLSLIECPFGNLIQK